MARKASKAELETAIRIDLLSRITELIETQLETDALPVSSSELAVPLLDAEGNEKFALIKVSIPRGTRNGNKGYIPYDGYKAHDEYIAEQESVAQERAVKRAMKAAEKNKNKHTDEDGPQFLPHEVTY